MIAKIIYFIKYHILKFFSKEPLFINKNVNAVPDILAPRVLYIEGNKMKNQFASFLCPCGCMEEININLETDEEPCWVLKSGLITSLSPSIWKNENCKSHFFIKNGKVKWCK